MALFVPRASCIAALMSISDEILESELFALYHRFFEMDYTFCVNFSVFYKWRQNANLLKFYLCEGRKNNKICYKKFAQKSEFEMKVLCYYIVAVLRR